MLNPLHNTKNQQVFEKHLCNKSYSCYKIRNSILYEWKASHSYHRIHTFAVRKDEWDTVQRRVLISPRRMNYFTAVWKNDTKGASHAYRMLNSKKNIKLIALAIAN